MLYKSNQNVNIVINNIKLQIKGHVKFVYMRYVEILNYDLYKNKYIFMSKQIKT